MILTDKEIQDRCSEGAIGIDPFHADSVEPASYDLCVGPQAASAATREITDVEDRGFAEVKPGDFVIVTTLEVVTLDARHTGRFGLTSTYARRGLIATVGPQVDPGFSGRLFVGLTNLSPKPIALPYRDKFLTVEFHRLDRPVEHVYDGPYQNRIELSPEDIREVLDRGYMSQTEVLRTLEALVTTVEGLKTAVAGLQGVEGKVNNLEGKVSGMTWQIPLFTSGIVAALLAIGGWIVSALLSNGS